MLKHRLVKAVDDQKGLATVEWVALSAVVCLAAIGISTMVLNGADRLGGAVAGSMEATANGIDGGGGGGGGG